MAFTGLSRAGRLGRATTGVAVGALAITAVTLLIAALTPSLDPWSLTGVYLFAVVPVAIGWGFWPASAAAVASYLAFEYFFVPVNWMRVTTGPGMTPRIRARLALAPGHRVIGFGERHVTRKGGGTGNLPHRKVSRTTPATRQLDRSFVHATDSLIA